MSDNNWFDAAHEEVSLEDKLTNGIWNKWKLGRKISHGKKPKLDWLSLRHIVEKLLKYSKEQGIDYQEIDLSSVLDANEDYEQNLVFLRQELGHVSKYTSEIEEELPDIDKFLTSEGLEMPSMDDPNFQSAATEIIQTLLMKFRDAQKERGKVKLTIDGRTAFVGASKITSMVEELQRKLMDSENQREQLQQQTKTTALPMPPGPLQMVMVKFVVNSQKYQSVVDQKVYGPYTAGQVASLHEYDANILISQGVAKAIVPPVSNEELNSVWNMLKTAWINGDDEAVDQNLKKIKNKNVQLIT